MWKMNGCRLIAPKLLQVPAGDWVRALTGWLSVHRNRSQGIECNLLLPSPAFLPGRSLPIIAHWQLGIKRPDSVSPVPRHQVQAARRALFLQEQLLRDGDHAYHSGATVHRQPR